MSHESGGGDVATRREASRAGALCAGVRDTGRQ